MPVVSAALVKFQFTHPGRGATFDNQFLRGFFLQFQFTHPGRGATTASPRFYLGRFVSIHAPREGCDSVVQSCVL